VTAPYSHKTLVRPTAARLGHVLTIHRTDGTKTSPWMGSLKSAVDRGNALTQAPWDEETQKTFPETREFLARSLPDGRVSLVRRAQHPDDRPCSFQFSPGAVDSTLSGIESGLATLQERISALEAERAKLFLMERGLRAWRAGTVD